MYKLLKIEIWIYMLFGALLQRWEEEAEPVLYFQTHDKNLHSDSNYTVGIKQYVNIINMHFIAAREKCPISAEGIRETGLETEWLWVLCSFFLLIRGSFWKYCQASVWKQEIHSEGLHVSVKAIYGNGIPSRMMHHQTKAEWLNDTEGFFKRFFHSKELKIKY